MSEEAPPCFLCGRPLGERAEWHHPELARFIAWVGGKDPDFHVPTRRGRK